MLNVCCYTCWASQPRRAFIRRSLCRLSVKFMFFVIVLHKDMLIYTASIATLTLAPPILTLMPPVLTLQPSVVSLSGRVRRVGCGSVFCFHRVDFKLVNVTDNVVLFYKVSGVSGCLIALVCLQVWAILFCFKFVYFCFQEI